MRWHSLRTSLLCALSLATIAPVDSRIAAQSPREVKSAGEPRMAARDRCVNCGVMLEAFAVVRDDQFPVATRSGVSTVVARNGQIVLSGLGGRLGLFDPRGRFVRIIARPGDGPGEFRYPLASSFTAGDSLVVVDPIHRRGTLLLSTLTGVARTFPIWPSASIEASGMPWIASGLVDRPEVPRRPLHLLSSDGAVLVSAGPAMPDTIRQQERVLARRFSPAGEGLIASVPGTELRLELIDRQLRVRRSFTHKYSWFPPYRDSEYGGPPDTPRWQTQVMGLSTDTVKGIAYVFVVRRASHPGGGTNSGKDARREPRIPTLAELDRFVETYVELLDLRTGRRLANVTVSGKLVPAIHPQTNGNGVIAFKDSLTSEGEEVRVLYRLRHAAGAGQHSTTVRSR